MSERMRPAEVKRRVSNELERACGDHFAGYVSVTPRDTGGHACAAWRAEHYEVFAYPIASNYPLEPIAAVLRGLPGATNITVRTTEDYAAEVRAAPRSRPPRPGVLAHLPVMAAD